MATGEKPVWAVSLAEILDLWCSENGYPVRTTFADELGISRSLWKHIASGDTISYDIAVYARIFQKTGLEEADPRSIPPRKVFIPKKGDYTDSPRAWTEEQWQDWLSNQSEPDKPQTTAGRKHPTTKHVPIEIERVAEAERQSVPQASLPTVGNLFDQLANSFGHQVAQVIREDLASSGISTYREEDAGRLMAKLTSKLKDMHAATREERELFIVRYGTQLGNLHAVLDPFIRDPVERERAVSLGERFER